MKNPIIQQEDRYSISEDEIENRRSPSQNNQMVKQKNNFSSFRAKIYYMETRLNDNAQEKGSSSWLTVLSVKQLGVAFLKVELWDELRLRHGLPMKRLTSQYRCPKL